MKQQCDCCGTCCRNGGPPLHKSDIGLVKTGILNFSDLVTVRRGELVLPPLATRPVSAEVEWIKIQGRDGDWCCRFLVTASNTCAIYENRPVSCRALKCWDTVEILAMSGRDLLCRSDLISLDDPLWPLVEAHEQICPVPDLEKLVRELAGGDRSDAILRELAGLVTVDLQVRSRAVQEFKLTVARELFYFGRPLFQILQPLGIMPHETPVGLELKYQQA